MPVYIVGGGVLGLMTAHELVQAGADVTVLDRQEVGRESSWAGGGILSPLYPWRYPDAVNRLALWGQQHYAALVEQFRTTSGVDAERQESGLLLFAVSDLEHARRWAKRMDVAVEEVGANAISQLEPAAGQGLGPALWMPQVAQVRNPRLIAALRASVQKKGVRIEERVTVTGFKYSRGRLRALSTNVGELPATQCLVAAGAWTAQVLESVGLNLPVKPIRGQMLLFRGAPGRVKRILLRNSHYIIPRADGRVLAGSTIEDVGFDASTSDTAREELLAAAVELAPALRDYTVERHWAGLRPGSPQGVPYIGEHPEIAGMVVCAGHYRNGIVMAPASARLAADLMLGRPPLFDPAPYGLEACLN